MPHVETLLTRPASVALLASGQIWTNLETLLMARDAQGIAQVAIFHTDDEQESARPARMLEWYCQERLGVAPRVVPGGHSVEAVRAFLAGLAGEWLVNATTGTKLMGYATTEAIPMGGRIVVYKERDGGWFRMRFRSGGFVAEPVEGVRASIDAMDVRDVVRMHLANPDAQVAGEPASPPPLARLQSCLDANGWDWRATRAALDLKSQPFEVYVAAAVAELGLRPFLNVMATAPDRAGKPATVLESDVLFLCGGKLFGLDCKVSGRDNPKDLPRIAQIEQAGARRRGLGGLGADYVMLRPHWEGVDPGHIELARLLNVRIWCEADMATFLDRLAALAKRPGALAAAQAALDRSPSPRFGERGAALPFAPQGEWIPAKTDLERRSQKDGYALLHLPWTLMVHTSGWSDRALAALEGELGPEWRRVSSANGATCVFLREERPAAGPDRAEATKPQKAAWAATAARLAAQARP